MTIFNVGGGGGNGGLTFKEMVAGPYEVKISDWSDNATTIRNYLFSHDVNLISVEIKDGITTIDNNAFDYTTNLETVYLPASLTRINGTAFGFSGIKSIDLTPVTTLGTNAFYQCKSLENVTLGNLTEIPNAAFYQNFKLESITIPASVTKINYTAFTSMARDIPTGAIVTMLPTTPPTLASNVFGSVVFNKIIVPQGTLTAYQTATNWSAYAQYMEEAA